MKKRLLLLLVFGLIIFAGCTKIGKEDVVNQLNKKFKNLKTYQIMGTLNITNNDDVYNYSVIVSYSNNKYRVSLTNKANDHEQIILKNKSGVYVITPSLNKSFKFQSDWPNNNSQIYLMESVVNDINNDKKHKVEEIEDGYVIYSEVNYPNNSSFVKQKVTVDKNYNIKMVEILDGNGIVQMIMKYDSIDFKANLDDDYFELDSIIEGIDTENSSDSSVNAIDDIIYPLYIPTGTVLVEQEKVSKNDGERIILTFEGEKPFLLVEETISVEDEFTIVPTYGEPYLLSDTIGSLTSNSLSWVSGGIEYYIVSDVMSQLELIEVAESISVIPTLK